MPRNGTLTLSSSWAVKNLVLFGGEMSIDIGVMLRGQYPFGVDMAHMAEELLEQARLADRLGYDSITKGSHYSTPDYQALQQIPLLARLSGEVKRARLNAGIIILPLHKPLDLAEQLATLDILSNGRLIFGVGIGYREVEFNAFGTTQKERGARANENLIAIKRLWSEDSVVMKGTHFELDNAVCWPKPIQKPNPPIWIGANANIAISRAAEFGDCWYINPHTTIETLAKQVDVYKKGAKIRFEDKIDEQIRDVTTPKNVYHPDYKIIDGTIEDIRKKSRKVCTNDYAVNNVYVFLQDCLKKISLAEK